MKTPKSSPPVMDVVTCSSGGPSPVNNGPSSNPLIPVTSSNASTISVSNGGGTNPTSNSVSNNSTLTITPKIEHSPPEHYERQTVLMWGATTNNNSNTSTNRPTSTTPTSNGLYNNDSNAHHLKLSNQMTIMSPLGMDEHHHNHAQQSHLKWNGNSKDIPAVSTVQVYQIHPHQDGNSNNVDTSAMYSHVPQSPHHLSHHTSSSVGSEQSVHHSPHSHHGGGVIGGGGLQASNHHAHQQQSIGSSCEVWSPAYSQYQYFTYHHAPQHASTQ